MRRSEEANFKQIKGVLRFDGFEIVIGAIFISKEIPRTVPCPVVFGLLLAPVTIRLAET